MQTRAVPLIILGECIRTIDEKVRGQGLSGLSCLTEGPIYLLRDILEWNVMVPFGI